MSHILRMFLFFVSAAITFNVPAMAGVPGKSAIIDNRAICHMQIGASIEAFIAAFEADFPTVGLAQFSPPEQIPNRPIHLLEVTLPKNPPPALLDQIEDAWESNYSQYLVSCEFLYENEVPEGHTGSTFVSNFGLLDYDNQYARFLLGLNPAHQRSTGVGTVIALVDTGMDLQHPELQGVVAPGGYNFIDRNTDFQDNGEGQMVGHGTFTAGILHLVAPDARILPLKALDSDGRGDGWLLAKAMFYAIDRGVEVINLSLGSTYDTAAVEIAMAEAESLGIPVFGAAGNLNRSEPEEYPAMNHDFGFGVAATDHNDIKADFSNYSRRLFISAPGDSVDGSQNPAQLVISTIPGGGYASWKGTSFAAPFAAGTAALIRAQHPQDWATGKDGQQAMNGIWFALASTAVNIYPMNPQYEEDQELGFGRLNTEAAIQLGPVAPMTLGDLDANGIVGFDDLTYLLANWGLGPHNSADLTGDGDVDFDDMVLLLANWS